MKEMEEKRGLLLIEEKKMESPTDLETGNDALDAYMSGLSSQLGLVLMRLVYIPWFCSNSLSCSFA